MEQRIGTRERELAMGALDEHHRAGRLDGVEYTERSSTAAGARVRSELDALFTDLPEPHPIYPGDDAPPVAAGRSAAPAPEGSTAPGSPSGRGGRAEDDLPELVAPAGAALARHAGLISALVPVIAFALFALSGFRFPLVFVLVPVAFAILGWLGHRHDR